MTQNALLVTLDGPTVDDTGVPAADFLGVLRGVQDAMRLMVLHIAGRTSGPGKPPAWLIHQSNLRLAPTRPGSFVAEFTHEPSADSQLSMESYGQQALTALRDWDGSEDSTLPRSVTDRLHETAGGLSANTTLWFGSAATPRQTEIRRRSPVKSAPSQTEQALLQGWLQEVNWAKGTAQLHDYSGDYAPLQFDPSFGEQMLKLATQYVEVRGNGSLNRSGAWTRVDVQRLSATRSWSAPFDLDAFLSDPEATPFAPSMAVTIDLTEEEWESFDQAIREAREA